MKMKEEAFSVSDFEVKGLKAQGVRLAAKEAASAQLGVTRSARRAATAAAQEELFPVKTGKTKKGATKGRATSPAKKGLRARAEAIAAKNKANPIKPGSSAKAPRKK